MRWVQGAIDRGAAGTQMGVTALRERGGRSVSIPSF